MTKQIAVTSDHQICLWMLILLWVCLWPYGVHAHSYKGKTDIGDYIQRFHCEDNPKIEGCGENNAIADTDPSDDGLFVPLATFISVATLWLILQLYQMEDPSSRKQIAITIVIVAISLAFTMLLT